MKDDRVYLKHIRDAILKIESYINGVNFEEFLEDTLIQDGVVRELEIIGEAARSLSSDFKDSHKDVPWRDITDMRNKLIHEYFRVDLDIVWKTVQEDIPKLKEQVEKLLS